MDELSYLHKFKLKIFLEIVANGDESNTQNVYGGTSQLDFKIAIINTFWNT